MVVGLLFATDEEVPEILNNILRNPKFKLIISGIGQKNASLATKKLCNYNLDYIILSGICGGIKSKSNIGDLVVAETIFYKQDKFFLKIPSSFEINKYTHNYKITNFQTFDNFVESNENVLEEVAIVDMESYAIATESKKRNIPLVIIKSVSDIVGIQNFDMKKAKLKLNEFFSNYLKVLST